ncbi:MAG: DMT family transporter [Bacteroidales bacterium]|nr:DMT family transporter [Bacteroidales bacterium]
MKHPARIYSFLAFFTAVIWGTTFISTKILLNSGLTPADIFLIRAVIAYLVLCLLHPRHFQPAPIRDEWVFILLGVFGGSLYFLTENTALNITLASNVSLIVTTAPIFTAIGAHFFVKEESLTRNLWIGAVIAFAGVFLVVYNGNFLLKINPLGDILSLSAAMLWAVYSILLRRVDRLYPTLYITRKIFFYGALTLLPWFLYQPFTWNVVVLSRPEVWLNLLFLGVIASSLCYVVWNKAIRVMGSIRTNNYIYFIPFITLLTAAIFLHEKLTVFSLLGAVLIFLGVYVTGIQETNPTGDKNIPLSGEK